MPWSAVFLIADFSGRGAVWREDLPPELAVDLAPHEERGASDQPEPSTVRITERDIKPPRRFTVLDGQDGDEPSPPPPPEEEPPGPPKPRPALRLVK